MKKIFILIICLVSSFAFASSNKGRHVSVVSSLANTAQVHIVENCTPEDSFSAGFNYVQVLMDDRGDYSLAIEWNRPIGREDVEELAADYFDDMTVYGFADYNNKAALFLYTKDDVDGERAELYLEGRNISVTCE